MLNTSQPQPTLLPTYSQPWLGEFGSGRATAVIPARQFARQSTALQRLERTEDSYLLQFTRQSTALLRVERTVDGVSCYRWFTRQSTALLRVERTVDGVSCYSDFRAVRLDIQRFLVIFLTTVHTSVYRTAPGREDGGQGYLQQFTRQSTALQRVERTVDGVSCYSKLGRLWLAGVRRGRLLFAYAPPERFGPTRPHYRGVLHKGVDRYPEDTISSNELMNAPGAICVQSTGVSYAFTRLAGYLDMWKSESVRIWHQSVRSTTQTTVDAAGRRIYEKGRTFQNLKI
ncbi:hypothetical protein Bbelb_325650 [Branchiostoma belcheri]|nr:hypothetical protein Bbelb_325650 [Branchiostoma belcheri]